MLKAILAAVALTASTGAVLAQDFDWEGFYTGLGISGGGTQEPIPAWGYPRNSGSFTYDQSLPRPVAFVGYNVLLGSSAMLGIELSVTGEVVPELTYGFPPDDTYFVTIQEFAAPVLSARAGAQLGDILLYGRVGGGLSVIYEEEVRNGVTEHEQTTINPIIEAGVGVEVEFDGPFLRAEANARHTFGENPYYAFDQSFTTFRAVGAVGFRLRSEK